MQLQHTARLAHPADQVYAFVSDLRRLAACVPGATIESGSADACVGQARIAAGPLVVKYAGEAHVVERDDDQRRLVFTAAAKGDGAAGRMDVTFDVSVLDEGAESTVVVVTDLRLKGIAAQLGRGPTEAVADQLIRGLVDTVEQRLAGGSAAAADAAAGDAASARDAAAAAVPPGAPSTLSATSLAGAAARGLLADERWRGLAVGVVVGLLLGRLRPGSGRHRGPQVICCCGCAGRRVGP